MFNEIKRLGKLAIQDFRTKQLSKIFPLKPTVLNLLVNDVCNSRCQMCLIWKNKKEQEFSPDELAHILDDDLFSDLKYVGVSGGEPTLRNDLPEIFEVICSKKPRIQYTGIITNAIIEDVVKKRVLDCAAICKAHNVKFYVMISLDGLEEVHDTVRGRKNNFDSAIKLLNYFHKETNIPTSFGCTITNSNALYVDELLDYAKSVGLYGRFRVAEFINRLYNEEQTEFIKNFDNKTLYHLGLFFFRAEHHFEKRKIYQKTYRNIRGMLVEGKTRQIGCPYQTKSVVLTSRGDLLYCSPKSPILGNTLQYAPRKLYFSNIAKRQEIIKKDCDNCIHDYHEPITFKEQLSSALECRRKNKIYNCAVLTEIASKLVKQKRSTTDLSSLRSKKVLIVGWYGTETVGDKAILWTVIKNLRSRSNPPKQIYLSSLYPFVSLWTVKEMELGDIDVVETYSKEFEKVCNEVDEVVIGGGPLMDIEPLNHILYAFIRAAKSKAFARVEGCGIGPLVSPRYVKVVNQIIRLSDHITLRDRVSTERCIKEFSLSQVSTVSDPAADYVLSIKNQPEFLQDKVPPLGKVRNVSCFLRKWTRKYSGNLNKAEYQSMKCNFEKQLTKLVIFIGQSKELDIHLLPMHTFHVGGDDRVFNRDIARQISHLIVEQGFKPSVDFAREPISPLEILQSMYHAELNICMRFHSVLFAETLDVPYIAIDYTGGGKIKAFLERKGKLDRLISLQDIAAGKWEHKIARLL
ncbi:MAG: polysaccharide pyruvyl transferase family protein [Xenococcaceae cyanobacterium MO_188.B29]|nr:polysaccharide pyruvyl transferase family protein [Xenococcaceae cyanobacterium MO_188.B29]